MDFNGSAPPTPASFFPFFVLSRVGIHNNAQMSHFIYPRHWVGHIRPVETQNSLSASHIFCFPCKEPSFLFISFTQSKKISIHHNWGYGTSKQTRMTAFTTHTRPTLHMMENTQEYDNRQCREQKQTKTIFAEVDTE